MQCELVYKPVTRNLLFGYCSILYILAAEVSDEWIYKLISEFSLKIFFSNFLTLFITFVSNSDKNLKFSLS